MRVLKHQTHFPRLPTKGKTLQRTPLGSALANSLRGIRILKVLNSFLEHSKIKRLPNGPQRGYALASLRWINHEITMSIHELRQYSILVVQKKASHMSSNGQNTSLNFPTPSIKGTQFFYFRGGTLFLGTYLRR